MTNNYNLNDLAAELDSIASLLTMLAAPMMEGENTFNPNCIGNSLFAVANHVDRVARSLDAQAEKIGA